MRSGMEANWELTCCYGAASSSLCGLFPACELGYKPDDSEEQKLLHCAYFQGFQRMSVINPVSIECSSYCTCVLTGLKYISTHFAKSTHVSVCFHFPKSLLFVSKKLKATATVEDSLLAFLFPNTSPSCHPVTRCTPLRLSKPSVELFLFPESKQAKHQPDIAVSCFLSSPQAAHSPATILQ